MANLYVTQQSLYHYVVPLTTQALVVFYKAGGRVYRCMQLGWITGSAISN